MHIVELYKRPSIVWLDRYNTHIKLYCHFVWHFTLSNSCRSLLRIEPWPVKISTYEVKYDTWIHAWNLSSEGFTNFLFQSLWNKVLWQSGGKKICDVSIILTLEFNIHIFAGKEKKLAMDESLQQPFPQKLCWKTEETDKGTEWVPCWGLVEIVSKASTRKSLNWEYLELCNDNVFRSLVNYLHVTPPLLFFFLNEYEDPVLFCS